ncbi:PPOX class probable F420-dependent enzyme [Rhodococcus sp. LBL1]|uniref:PPOX class probable F420-dependent enzyme n=1 Tax=Prescottella agglutinans TaxID=1644129 RepID=A0ABT6MC34_9NOCA|nr:pyridoxamine 5'-phosphate oxidase family protein [Prescottella agglutinans]MDH6281865.1 PPOX class probable F420-dependent enzyme [Prescottella agglutinans]MDH6679929.1 PPOX class probable F420-dependent enzyme [Rhodococcus sp. LBL1]MDH6684759.1 PPOX class probable F420-dependent enzyme [Rhodococcus sp. LBL2]
MSKTTMSENEREQFLADKHVGVIAAERDGRAPLAVPVWYHYSPGGEVMVWTERGTVKERLIRAGGRFSLCAQQEDPPYRYVSVEGPATFQDDVTADDVRPLVRRYLPDADAEAFIAESFNDKSVVIRMRPERWFTVDYGKLQS